jgi:hypothetical protein
MSAVIPKCERQFDGMSASQVGASAGDDTMPPWLYRLKWEIDRGIERFWNNPHAPQIRRQNRPSEFSFHQIMRAENESSYRRRRAKS